jgi:hypothetical protein
MRSPLLLLLFAPAALVSAAHAQPARDEAGIAAAFARIVGLAHGDSVEAALPLVACPVRGEAGAVTVTPCGRASIEHRARVEWQLALVHRLFPTEPTALRPHYAVEHEGDVGFHLLMFSDLPAAPYALVSFTDVDGAHLFAEVQVEERPADVPPPASVVAAFERVLAAAEDEATTVERFAPLVVARGEDPGRAGRAPADPAREDERRFVAGLLESLRSLLAQRVSHEVVGFDLAYEAEGAWHVLQTRFSNGAEEEPVAFAFVPVGGAFLLGDVDG